MRRKWEILYFIWNGEIECLKHREHRDSGSKWEHDGRLLDVEYASEWKRVRERRTKDWVGRESRNKKERRSEAAWIDCRGRAGMRTNPPPDGLPFIPIFSPQGCFSSVLHSPYPHDKSYGGTQPLCIPILLLFVSSSTIYIFPICSLHSCTKTLLYIPSTCSCL